MPLWPATKPVMRSCICSNHRMVWGTPKIMPEWRTGCTVIVAVGTIKLRRALTASGMPMEWPPPSTTVALGFEMLAMSSASASPASTSPPTVLMSTSRPSTAGSSCTATSCGITCSYLVVFWPCGASTWPSIWPITVRQWMAWGPRVRHTVPRSSSCSFSSRCCSVVSFSYSGMLAPPQGVFFSVPGNRSNMRRLKFLYFEKNWPRGFDILSHCSILYVRIRLTSIYHYCS